LGKIKILHPQTFSISYGYADFTLLIKLKAVEFFLFTTKTFRAEIFTFYWPTQNYHCAKKLLILLH